MKSQPSLQLLILFTNRLLYLSISTATACRGHESRGGEETRSGEEAHCRRARGHVGTLASGENSQGRGRTYLEGEAHPEEKVDGRAKEARSYEQECWR